MKIISVCPSSFAANTYLLVSGNQALVVDPSVSVNSIKNILDNENAILCGIILTHGHFDHTVSVDTIRDQIDVPLIIHAADSPMLTNGRLNGFYDFYGKELLHRPAQRLLSDNDVIFLGNEEIKVISTPGHSPGSVCFLCHDDNNNPFLITGDTLFSNTIGRCDLWGGDEKAIALSLRALKELDTNMPIYPGHGPSEILAKALQSALYYTDF